MVSVQFSDFLKMLLNICRNKAQSDRQIISAKAHPGSIPKVYEI